MNSPSFMRGSNLWTPVQHHGGDEEATVRRLRTILIIRGVLAILLLALGVVALEDGRTVFGVLLLAMGTVNGVLIAVLSRRRRLWARRVPGVGAGPGGGPVRRG
jgi:hypothetical protein